jgi:hypothetical protein
MTSPSICLEAQGGESNALDLKTHVELMQKRNPSSKDETDRDEMKTDEDGFICLGLEGGWRGGGIC